MPSMSGTTNLIELRNQEEIKFEVFSLEGELLTASLNADGKKMIHGVASSTTKDLHGDTILLSALEDMERTAVGLTVFRNHKYDVPDDVGGTITKAIIRQKGVDDKGDPNYQLEVDIEVEDENPAALQTWKFIQKGRKLGLSIGAMIPTGGAKRQKDGSYIIEHLLLLELSMVGIPANPKSWIDYAASALRGMIEKSKTTELGNPTLTLDGENYKIEGSVKGLKLDLAAEPISFVPEVAHNFALDAEGKVQIVQTETVESGGGLKAVVLGAWDFADPDEKLLAIATVGEDVVEKATVWVTTRDGDQITIGDPPVENDANPEVVSTTTPDVTDAGCPSCGGSKGSPKGGCSNGYHAAAPDPDVTDAKIRVIEVDTDDKPSSGDGQGASESEPDDEGSFSAPAPEVVAEGTPPILEELDEEALMKLSFGQMQAAALIVLKELIEVKRQLAEEKVARAEADRQRTEAIEAAGQLAQQAVKIIEKIADSPLPRKAVFKDAGVQLSSSIEAYYGTEIARAAGVSQKTT